MNVFDGVKKCTRPHAHGEVNFFKIEEGTANLDGFEDVKPEKNQFVVGHSESGNCHVLDAPGVTMKRGSNKGMEVLFAILEKPAELKQDAGSPHKKQIVQPGAYIITNNTEYDPFTQQARRVAD